MITPQSLRRRSELATKKALKNPIIGGVFTSWEDPALKALETLDLKSNKNKKKKQENRRESKRDENQVLRT